MKLAISARGEGLEADVDQRFGRCPFFVIVDTDTEQVVESVKNSNATAAGGAGPQSAQLLSDKGVEAVALGNVGPNAAVALNAAGIKIFSGINGTVNETVQNFKAGKLVSVDQATVTSHHGMKS